MREDAFLRVALQVDQGLAQGAPTSAAVLEALREQHGAVVSAAADALAADAPEHATHRDVTEPELVAVLAVLQIACLYDPGTQRAACERGVLSLLLRRLPGGSPALACACFDTLMSIQHGQPAAFALLVRERGIEQVCEVLRRGSDRVRAHAARFLNLLLTHLAPALRGPSTEEDIVLAAQGVIGVLGREASAMLHRRVDLADVQAEAKLAQLSNALQFFMG